MVHKAVRLTQDEVEQRPSTEAMKFLGPRRQLCSSSSIRPFRLLLVSTSIFFNSPSTPLPPNFNFNSCTQFPNMTTVAILPLVREERIRAALIPIHPATQSVCQTRIQRTLLDRTTDPFSLFIRWCIAALRGRGENDTQVGREPTQSREGTSLPVPWCHGPALASQTRSRSFGERSV